MALWVPPCTLRSALCELHTCPGGRWTATSPASTCLNDLLILLGSKCCCIISVHTLPVPMLDLTPLTTVLPCQECPSDFYSLIQTLPHLLWPYLLGAPDSSPYAHLGLSAWWCFHELPVSTVRELTSVLSTRAWLLLLSAPEQTVGAQ